MGDARPLLAYAVQEDYEDTGGIIFARHAIAARRRGADEFNDGELRGMTCQRARWADRYAPGPVPKLAMIDAGWSFACIACECRIGSDCEDEDGNALDPVEIGSCLWCSPACRMYDLIAKTQRKAHELAAISKLRLKLWEILPGVTLTDRAHAFVSIDQDGKLECQQCIVGFTFPGATIDSGEYRFDKPGDPPRLTVPKGDLEAFHAWRAATKAKAAQSKEGSDAAT